MHTTLAALDLATLDFRVVTFGDFESRSKHTLDNNSLHNLLCSFALKVNAHNLAVGDPTILDLDGVVWVGKTVDRTRLEIIERCIGNEDI